MKVELLVDGELHGTPINLAAGDTLEVSGPPARVWKAPIIWKLQREIRQLRAEVQRAHAARLDRERELEEQIDQLIRHAEVRGAMVIIRERESVW